MSMGDMNRARSGDGDLAVTVQSLVRRVHRGVEDENRKLKETVDQIKEENVKFVEEVREDLSKHITMLKILFSNNEYLEGVALGVRRRTLTDFLITNKPLPQFDACVAAIKARKDNGRWTILRRRGIHAHLPSNFRSKVYATRFRRLETDGQLAEVHGNSRHALLDLLQRKRCFHSIEVRLSDASAEYSPLPVEI